MDKGIRCSPPTRGWTGGRANNVRDKAVFPAYAGMDRRWRRSTGHWSRVPRLRGDGPWQRRPNPLWSGCSPPTRGWTGRAPEHRGCRGVFPAYAGMDRSVMNKTPRVGGVPRLRGDGPTPTSWVVAGVACSPPTRGWTEARAKAEDVGSVFPAYAGMDRKKTLSKIPGLRVPRLRGDGPCARLGRRAALWCSPPTRGWTAIRDIRDSAAWVFPAYAGMDHRSYGPQLL